MASVAERLARARADLEAAGLFAADAAFDAEVLARHLLGWDRAALIARGRDPEPPDFPSRFAELIARRLRREPVAQIVGVREFWGLEFEVTRDVLVPRPETELVIDEALSFARERPCRQVIDVGTGSGCLAVTLAHELADVHVIAVDTSAAALAVAQRNAARHGVTGRVTFHQGDVLSGIDGAADLIMSNPPYVPDSEADVLQPEVVRYEPHRALFGGPDGLDVIRRLFTDAPPRLAPNGRLVVEFGYGQHDRVRQLAEQTGWTIVGVRRDLQSIPRTLALARSPRA